MKKSKTPKTLIITEEQLEIFTEELYCDLIDEISEYLSDISGYCHKGFNFEIKVKNIQWDKTE